MKFFPFLLFFFLTACNNVSETREKSIVLKQNQKITSFENKKVKSLEYYENGKISSVTMVLDSLILPEIIEISEKIYTFHRNGKLKSVSFQGFYNGNGVPVYKEKIFNAKGEKTLEIIYHNDVFGKDYIIYNHYKKDSIYLTEKFNNYILYETEKKLFNEK